MKGTFAYWQDLDRRYAVIRIDDTDEDNSEPKYLQHGDDVTMHRGHRLPCPGIPLHDGAFSGCSGGQDCPVCEGKEDWLFRLAERAIAKDAATEQHVKPDGGEVDKLTAIDAKVEYIMALITTELVEKTMRSVVGRISSGELERDSPQVTEAVTKYLEAQKVLAEIGERVKALG